MQTQTQFNWKIKQLIYLHRIKKKKNIEKSKIPRKFDYKLMTINKNV